MAEIRISKLAKQFSIGVQTLVEFLNEKGAGLGTDPNAKISDEYLLLLEEFFCMLLYTGFKPLNFLI